MVESGQMNYCFAIIGGNHEEKRTDDFPAAGGGGLCGLLSHPGGAFRPCGPGAGLPLCPDRRRAAGAVAHRAGGQRLRGAAVGGHRSAARRHSAAYGAPPAAGRGRAAHFLLRSAPRRPVSDGATRHALPSAGRAGRGVRLRRAGHGSVVGADRLGGDRGAAAHGKKRRHRPRPLGAGAADRSGRAVRSSSSAAGWGVSSPRWTR